MMQIIAKNQGYYRVTKDAQNVSQHVQERKAVERAIELKKKYPNSSITYHHDYRVQVGDAPDTPFTIYDCTELYPESVMTPIGMAYSSLLWDSETEYPGPANIADRAAYLTQRNPTIGVIDIERWSTRLYEIDQVNLDQNLERFLHVLESFRQQRPSMKLGFYGRASVQIYSHDESKFKDMFDRDTQALQPLMEAVDFIAPTFYTRWLEDNKQEWATCAEWNIRRTRAFTDKQIIPFISPQWWESLYGAPNGSKKREYVSGAYWQLMLDTMQAHADGAIVYQYHKEDPQVAKSNPWYRLTEELITNER